jgi:uncharacterized protein (DUF58 family)
MSLAIISPLERFTFSWRELWRGILSALTLLLALAAALASSVTARAGNLSLTLILTLLSLVLAAIVAYAVIPALFRRARLEWLHLPFAITREGWFYLMAILIVGLAAFNTNNNLLFIIFSATLATFVISGVLSRINLKQISIELDLPETIEARQRVRLPCHLKNQKRIIPSFSIAVQDTSLKNNGKKNSSTATQRLSYFSFLPSQTGTQQWISLEYPRRGRYPGMPLALASGFPFGFVRRERRGSTCREVLVLPELEPPNEFFETLPLLHGAFESHLRGEGSDLYSIRDYSSQENSRFLDWKATAKTGQLKIREFTREDERKCCFVFDNGFPDFEEERHRVAFEKAVRLCANAARHFHEMASEIRLLTPEASTVFASSPEGLLGILKILAVVEPERVGGISLAALADENSFKVLFTAQGRGAIPTSVWNTSHVVFMRELV